MMPARKEETVRAVEDAAAVSLPIDGAVGLGVDIVEIARMKKILERTPSFARKVGRCGMELRSRLWRARLRG